MSFARRVAEIVAYAGFLVPASSTLALSTKSDCFSRARLSTSQAGLRGLLDRGAELHDTFMGLFSDPLSFTGRLADNLGLPVTPYAPPPIVWKRPLWLILLLPILYLSVLNALRGVLDRSTTDPKRKNVGWAMIVFVVGFPFLWGSQSSGSKVVDFALAVIAFVLSLRLYRITFLRPVEQTIKWTLVEYYGRLFTFPTEQEREKTSNTRDFGASARIENAKDLGMATLKVGISLFFIRCIPPPDAFQDMSWFQRRVYYAVLGGILLVCLEGFVGGFFGAYGLLCNRHMRRESFSSSLYFFSRPAENVH